MHYKINKLQINPVDDGFLWLELKQRKTISSTLRSNVHFCLFYACLFDCVHFMFGLVYVGSTCVGVNVHVCEVARKNCVYVPHKYCSLKTGFFISLQLGN